MKVLRIIARLNVGGPARHVVWLTEHLNDDEFQSTLIAGTVPPGEKDMAYLADERGIKPLYIPQMSRELSPKDVVSLFKIFREIRRIRPDIIHTHTAKAGTIGRVAALLHRILGGRVRVVHTFHGHVFHSYYGRLKTAFFIAVEKILARVATDRIIAISPEQFREIHEEFGVGRAAQFTVVPLGIDVAAFAPSATDREDFRRELHAAQDEILVGFVGRLTEIKDVSMYLRVAAEVFQDPDAPPMRFVIAGDGHLRPKLEEEARKLGLAETVVFLGNRTDPERVYAGVDIVGLTSLNEGTPLSLIEAMAAERPFIATAVGGVADLLGETIERHEGFRICERGLGVDTRSFADYTKSLIYLAKNGRLRKSLAENGLKFAQREYSKDRLVDDVKRLYRTLANR